MLKRVQESLPTERAVAARLEPLRVRGGVALRFQPGERGTICASLREADGYRARLPASTHCEAVILNTGGGVAGGDDVQFAFSAAPGARACVTSVAAERIYRSNGPDARLSIAIDAGEGATLAFLPQETILFDGARLSRRLVIDVSATARVTLVDMLVFARRGSGEQMSDGALEDQWHLRRDGQLIHREATRIAGDIDAGLAGPATGGGAHVLATLLHVAPDANEALEGVRALLPADDGQTLVAASAWNGKLVVRALAKDCADLTPILARLIPPLSGFPVPRSWSA